VHDRSPPKDVCSGSLDLFNCGEITDKILKMVLDNDMVTVED